MRDRTGEKYKYATVESFAFMDRHYIAHWNCRCVCGKIFVADPCKLASGERKSCGCMRIEEHRKAVTKHGNSRHGFETREWRAWRGGAKNRCYNPNNNRWKHYGGRGIKVCEQWLNSFESFLLDMGKCPPGLTLERLNRNKNYEPGNCVWADFKTQNNNRTCCRLIEFNGEKKTVSQWAENLGIPYSRISSRINRGWTMDQISKTPNPIYNGKIYSSNTGAGIGASARKGTA